MRSDFLIRLVLAFSSPLDLSVKTNSNKELLSAYCELLFPLNNYHLKARTLAAMAVASCREERDCCLSS